MATAVTTTAACRNFIGGKWVESFATQFLERRNPANTDEIVARVPLSTREEMRDAIAAARAAFPAWRETPAPERGKILFRAVCIMENEKEALARLLTREEGKALSDSLGEMQRGINILEFMAGEARRLNGENYPSELRKNVSYSIKVPLGVVGAITPWNFPFCIPVWKIAPALVTGNTCVLKPAELTPLCAIRMAEIFAEAGLPAGVLNVVLGSGEEVGDELVQHRDVRAISFTGSTEIGCQIYASGARRMQKVQCEMGGKNPAVILADADLALAVQSVLFGAFASTGQRCTATSRVIIERSVADKFAAMLLERANAFRVGNGLDAGIEMGPSVDETQMNSVLKYVEIGKQEGTLILGGHRLTGGAYDKGYFVEPTIFDHVPIQSRIAQEEIFGPVLSIIRVDGFDDAVEAANSCRYGLSSSIYTNDAARIFEFIDRIETGITHVNSSTVGGEAHIPFGGIKDTGVGPREVGHTALDFYTEMKTVYIDYTGRKRESSVY
jgi:alpha-ketoglutaric semialdehyde dehydrogenase